MIVKSIELVTVLNTIVAEAQSLNPLVFAASTVHLDFMFPVTSSLSVGAAFQIQTLLFAARIVIAFVEVQIDMS